MTPRYARALQDVARWVATILVAPELLSYLVRSRLIGRDRALEGSTQALGLIPGLTGRHLRVAFLARTLAGCHRSAVIEWGTTFSKAGARVDEGVYIGPGCRIGLADLGRDVLIAAGAHIPSGARTHGSDLPGVPIRDQPTASTLVRIGAGAWVGSGAVVMADVGPGAIIGAGAVVTRPVPAGSVAAGVPAREVRRRGVLPGPEPAEVAGEPGGRAGGGTRP